MGDKVRFLNFRTLRRFPCLWSALPRRCWGSSTTRGRRSLGCQWRGSWGTSRSGELFFKKNLIFLLVWEWEMCSDGKFSVRAIHFQICHFFFQISVFVWNCKLLIIRKETKTNLGKRVLFIPSRRPSSVSTASAPGWPRTRTARGASCSTTLGRRSSPPPTGCSPRSRTRWGRRKSEEIFSRKLPGSSQVRSDVSFELKLLPWSLFWYHTKMYLLPDVWWIGTSLCGPKIKAMVQV